MNRIPSRKRVGGTRPWPCLQPGPSGQGRPGDDFNQRGDVRAILRRHGWTLAKAGENEYWRRPGKTSGSSATLKDGVFYVFSSSAAPFEPDRPYAPFSVYALLEHGGDFVAAATALRAEGFGGETCDDAGVDLSGITRPNGRAMSFATNVTMCRTTRANSRGTAPRSGLRLRGDGPVPGDGALSQPADDLLRRPGAAGLPGGTQGLRSRRQPHEHLPVGPGPLLRWQGLDSQAQRQDPPRGRAPAVPGRSHWPPGRASRMPFCTPSHAVSNRRDRRALAVDQQVQGCPP